MEKVKVVGTNLILKCPECKTIGNVTRCPGCDGSDHVNHLLQVGKKIGCPACLSLLRIDKLDIATGEVELTLVKKYKHEV